MVKKSSMRNQKFSTPIKITVIISLLLLVIVPIFRMFFSMTGEDIKNVVTSPLFGKATLNSVLLSLIATVISLTVALLLAFSVTRGGIKHTKVWNILLTLPMLIPSISHGMGLIILFGGNGIIKNLLGLENSIYGPVGIVTGSVLYAFPIAYIMLADILKYEDMSVYEAADVLGIGKIRQFFKITLPYLRRPLIAAAFSQFSLIITDYGVPLMIGGKTKTISLMMYEEVIGQLDFGKGCVYGAFLLIPAIIAFVADLLNKDGASSSFVTRETDKKPKKALTALSYTFSSLIVILSALPIVSFVILAFAKSYPRDMSFTFENISETLRLRGASYMVNSLLIALLTALIGTAISYLVAYLTSRMKSSLSRVIHLITLTFMAIPGLVLGLSYVVSFSATPLYGTIIIMVMVNIAHFVSSPYLIMYNTFGKMNENLEAVGATLGVSRIRMIKDVFIPQNLSSIGEMFSYLFVNSMMTISAVSFLANTATKPISLMINQFEAQMMYECAAVVSLMILITNVILKALIGSIKIINDKKDKIRHGTYKKAI